MSKVNLNDLTNITGQELSAISTLNGNNTLIETAMENTPVRSEVVLALTASQPQL